MPLIEVNEKGIYCAQAQVYIDPWKPVDKALITHAHADHARWGHRHYLTSRLSKAILEHRLKGVNVQTLNWNESIDIHGVKFSFHPAGHVIGSAQIRIEYKGEIWVVSGDYKMEKDPIAASFEPLKCHHFISECTFGLPVFRWQSNGNIADQMNQWWANCQSIGQIAIVGAYSLGKGQRVLSMLDASLGPIYVHTSIGNINTIIEKQGIKLPPHQVYSAETKKSALKGAIIIAPPSAINSSWIRHFRPYETAMASGWMALRGNKRRRNVDRGFVLSDHADWSGLIKAIKATEAEKIYLTHGYKTVFAQYLNDRGIAAYELETELATDENI